MKTLRKIKVYNTTFNSGSSPHNNVKQRKGALSAISGNSLVQNWPVVTNLGLPSKNASMLCTSNILEPVNSGKELESIVIRLKNKRLSPMESILKTLLKSDNSAKVRSSKSTRTHSQLKRYLKDSGVDLDPLSARTNLIESWIIQKLSTTGISISKLYKEVKAITEKNFVLEDDIEFSTQELGFYLIEMHKTRLFLTAGVSSRSLVYLTDPCIEQENT